MSFMTTAEDCKYLINHYEEVVRKFLLKAKSPVMPVNEKMCFIANTQWAKKRIKYYSEKQERLERLGL